MFLFPFFPYCQCALLLMSSCWTHFPSTLVTMFAVKKKIFYFNMFHFHLHRNNLYHHWANNGCSCIHALYLAKFEVKLHRIRLNLHAFFFLIIPQQFLPSTNWRNNTSLQRKCGYTSLTKLKTKWKPGHFKFFYFLLRKLSICMTSTQSNQINNKNIHKKNQNIKRNRLQNQVVNCHCTSWA